MKLAPNFKSVPVQADLDLKVDSRRPVAVGMEVVDMRYIELSKIRRHQSEYFDKLHEITKKDLHNIITIFHDFEAGGEKY